MANIDWSMMVTAEQKAAKERADILVKFQAAIQAHVDAVAHSCAYDSGNSLASYVASSNPLWATEAEAFVAWRDAVWVYAYAELDKVSAQERDVPPVEGFIDELPAIEWPAT